MRLGSHWCSLPCSNPIERTPHFGRSRQCRLRKPSAGATSKARSTNASQDGLVGRAGGHPNDRTHTCRGQGESLLRTYTAATLPGNVIPSNGLQPHFVFKPSRRIVTGLAKSSTVSEPT